MARGKKGVITQGPETVPEAQRFASGAEISGRDRTTKQSAPTHFTQIGPEDSPGKNAGSMDQGAELKTTSGNKFSSFTP